MRKNPNKHIHHQTKMSYKLNLWLFRLLKCITSLTLCFCGLNVDYFYTCLTWNSEYSIFAFTTNPGSIENKVYLSLSQTIFLILIVLPPNIPYVSWGTACDRGEVIWQDKTLPLTLTKKKMFPKGNYYIKHYSPYVFVWLVPLYHRVALIPRRKDSDNNNTNRHLLSWTW